MYIAMLFCHCGYVICNIDLAPHDYIPVGFLNSNCGISIPGLVRQRQLTCLLCGSHRLQPSQAFVLLVQLEQWI